MNGVALLVALASLGVDYGVQQSEDGKLEYVIQIEPEYLRLLAEGQQIHSDVPPDAGQIERILVRVGTTPARHTQAMIAEYRNLLVSSGRTASRLPGRAAADSSTAILWPAKAKPELTSHVTYGYQPEQNGVLSYFVQLHPTLLGSLAVGDEVRAVIDPAAGRVGRFVIHAGDAELPKVPAAPTASPTGSTTGSRRSVTDRTGLGAATRDAAAAPSTYGPPTAFAPSTSPPADRAPAPLAGAPDFGVSPSFGGQYADRGPPTYGGASDAGTELRAPAPVAPAYQPPQNLQPPSGYTDSRFDRLRSVAEQAPVEYGPPAGYAARAPSEHPQVPLRTNSYAPPAGYAPPPDDRVASVTRPAPTAADRLPAPQITPTSTTRSADAAADHDKPWMPLMFTAFALFLSIGGNLYLGWTAAEFYSRYRLATDRLRSAGRS